MCPFSFGTGFPKTITKLFHLFLGLFFPPPVLKKVQTGCGTQAETGHFPVSICTLFSTYTTLWDSGYVSISAYKGQMYQVSDPQEL